MEMKKRERVKKMENEKTEGFKIEIKGLEKNRDFLRNTLVLAHSEVLAKKKNTAGIALFVPVVLILAAAAFVTFNIEDNSKSEKTNNLGGIWCTYKDAVYGSSSVIWPPVPKECENLFMKSSPGYGNKGYAVRITGVAGTLQDNIGVQTFLVPYESCPKCIGIDISRFKGVRFMLKGSMSNGKLVFIIPYENQETEKTGKKCISMTGGADYEADITEYMKGKWKEVKLDFRKDFKQPFWTETKNIFDIEKVLLNVNAFRWRIKEAQNAEFDIWIDDLQLY